jgi:hypothetical protein
VEHEKKHTSDRVLGFLLSLGAGIGRGDLSTVNLPQIKGGGHVLKDNGVIVDSQTLNN